MAITKKLDILDIEMFLFLLNVLTHENKIWAFWKKKRHTNLPNPNYWRMHAKCRGSTFFRRKTNIFHDTPSRFVLVKI